MEKIPMSIPRIGMMTVLLLAAACAPLSAETIHAQDCLIMLIDEAQVAAQESGVLVEVTAMDGQQVEKDQPLAKVDDKLAILQRNVAKAELDVAEKESKNIIAVKYAEATAAVAYRECQRHREANAKIPNAIAQSDVDKALLALEEAKTYIDKALFDLDVKKYEVEVKKASVEASDEHILRRTVTAPWSGAVDRVIRHEGDWVEPGDPILRLIRMDKLRVKCTLDGNLYNPSDVDGQPVTVTVNLARGAKAIFQGTVIGISPLVQADNHFQVWAEVINKKEERGYWILRDGMSANMDIEISK